MEEQRFAPLQGNLRKLFLSPWDPFETVNKVSSCSILIRILALENASARETYFMG